MTAYMEWTDKRPGLMAFLATVCGCLALIVEANV